MSESGVKKGPWTAEEDQKLIDFISRNGHGSWRALPKLAGLNRCGKSCRLRWTNYLRPDIKRGNFSPEEHNLIINLHAVLGNKWSTIAGHLPGRTDNEIKNLWNTHLKKKLLHMGIDPVTHRPRTDFSNSSSLNNLILQLLISLNNNNHSLSPSLLPPNIINNNNIDHQSPPSSSTVDPLSMLLSNYNNNQLPYSNVNPNNDHDHLLNPTYNHLPLHPLNNNHNNNNDSHTITTTTTTNSISNNQCPSSSSANSSTFENGLWKDLIDMDHDSYNWNHINIDDLAFSPPDIA